jgi:[acyl-carrier-protein] S-malonyltransferase
VLFPGQGAQRPGMGREWFGGVGWAVVEEADRITGRDLGKLLLDADADTLKRTDNAQLAVLTLELVILRELQSAGLLPTELVTVVAGHSLGEYAALSAAGILQAGQAVRLVDRRARAMLAACRLRPGTMAVAVGLPVTVVQHLVSNQVRDGDELWVANLNSADQVVVSGSPAAIARFAPLALDAGARTVVNLAVGGAFHSPFMASAADDLALGLAGEEFQTGQVPVLSNVDAVARSGSAQWRALLARQVVAPVRWHDSMLQITGTIGCDVLVEIGPGRALAGLAKAIAPQVPRFGISTPEHLKRWADEWVPTLNR